MTPGVPTHCPWPTIGSLDQFAACYALRDQIIEWTPGAPESTFDLAAPRALQRAWTLTHVSPMPPFLAAIHAQLSGQGTSETLALVLVIHRYNLRFETWDILAKEYQTPRHRPGLVREGKAIHDFLVHNKLPIPLHAINPPDRPHAKAS